MRTALLEPMPPMERDTTMLDEQPEQIQGILKRILHNIGIRGLIFSIFKPYVPLFTQISSIFYQVI